MSIQDRYDEIAAMSGISEQMVRRVLKATRQSLAKSLKQGNRATLPGVCTIYPEVRSKLNWIENGTKSSTQYIKLKAKASSALETEFNSLQHFEEHIEPASNEDIMSQLNLKNPDLHDTNGETVIAKPALNRYNNDRTGIITNQISALL